MPKPKAHARPHSRQGSSTSVARMGGLTRSDSNQRLSQLSAQMPQALVQASQTAQSKKGKQQQQQQQQQPIIQQPASRKQANGHGNGTRQPGAAANAAGADEDDDAWVSSESGAVTPNHEPEDQEPVTPSALAPPDLTPRAEIDELTATGTPKPVLKLTMPDATPERIPSTSAAAAAAATITRETPAPPPARATVTTPRAAPAPALALIESPAVDPFVRHEQPSRRPRPQSAIFPAGMAMTQLHPDPPLRRGSTHTVDDRASRKSRPVSVHSLAGIPARPHPLLRGLSQAGVAAPAISSAGTLLSADAAHALLSLTASTSHLPRSSPSSPGSGHAVAATTGRLFRRPSTSSIKSVATLPATSTATAMSDLNALSTSPGSQSVSARTMSGLDDAANRARTMSGSQALSSLIQNAAANKAGVKGGTGRSSEPHINRLVVTFAQARASDPAKARKRQLVPLLSEERMARHEAVTQWVQPGLASLQRVLAQRGPLGPVPPAVAASSSRARTRS